MGMQTVESRFQEPSTMLGLIQSLLDEDCREDEVVSRAAEMVGSGEILLTGNFRGCTQLFAEAQG